MDLKMEWPEDYGCDEYLFDYSSKQTDSWRERVYDDDLYFDEELSVLLQLKEKNSTGDGCY